MLTAEIDEIIICHVSSRLSRCEIYSCRTPLAYDAVRSTVEGALDEGQPSYIVRHLVALLVRLFIREIHRKTYPPNYYHHLKNLNQHA